MRDVLVTKDDNGVVDETQTLVRKDETQADGECELQLQEEVDAETGEIKQVFVSDCADLEAKNYKKEFTRAQRITRELNNKYKTTSDGRTQFKTRGWMWRASPKTTMNTKIERYNLNKRPAQSRLAAVDMNSKQSLMAALRRLYGKTDKPVKVYRLNRGDSVAAPSWASKVNHNYSRDAQATATEE